MSVTHRSISRRAFLAASSVAASSLAVSQMAGVALSEPVNSGPTQFQVACMTLPYSKFPLKRALEGIKSAGYKYVAWGTSHVEDGGQRVPVMASDAPVNKAKELGQRCRDMGLEPVMMFSTIYPEAEKGLEVLTHRIKQAAAAGVGQVLTFGHTKGGNREIWIERFKKLGPIAADHNVLLVVKQHGGSTGTGEACAKITREVKHENVKVNFDAGNVMDYLDVDPIPDILECRDELQSLCIKDHRNWPKDQDCGPGYGEIDHYRLLAAIAFLGRKVPLCCENIFAPLVARPEKPEPVDALAQRARVFLDTVIAGLHADYPEANQGPPTYR
ncbi:MAG: sugar phosphate isomerase/epimerase [Pirellulaceae bacterium]|jgi:sugar phosphate isomerase/epimerase